MGVKQHIYIVFFLSFFIFLESFAQIDNRFRFQSNMYQKNDINSEYHIVFLLPLCLEDNNVLYSNDIDSLANMNLEGIHLYKKTKISIDFYLGFLSSLKEFQNTKIKISLFDIKEGYESKDILIDILNQNYLNHADLIIGPLFTDNFLFFKDILDRNIPIISPFSKKPYITQGNENVFQLPPSMSNHLSFLSEYIFDTHMNDNLLLIRRDTIFTTRKNNTDTAEDYALITDTLVPEDIFYSQKILSNIDTMSMFFEEIKVHANIIDSIHHKLDTLGMKNIIIIPSEDNVFVTDLLSKLHACRDTNMIVYGMPGLSNFYHVSIYDLMDMKVTFPQNKSFDTNATEEFIINFYSDYSYIPNLKYASVGYELGYYFLDILFDNGSIMPYVNDVPPKTILGTTYHFKKERNGGYQNKATLLFQYHDFGFRVMK
tara:strand:- start:3821 stop:5107 length:1287 start_codon:yes stop_codon:yes gene_type:complete